MKDTWMERNFVLLEYYISCVCVMLEVVEDSTKLLEYLNCG